MEFKVGDRVRYIPDGDEGTVTLVDGSWIDVRFEEDGETCLQAGELELISGNSEEATKNRAKSFAETVAKLTGSVPAVSKEEIEGIRTLGAELGIAIPPNAEERAHVRELLGVSSFEQSVRRHTDRIANVLVEKNKQYANSALDPIRVFSKADRMEQLRVRADDKLSRIRNGDTSEDALTDLAGYIILLKIAEESN